MSRLIHVVIVEQDNRDYFSIGVIDNITIDCKESFILRLKKALDEHFDGDSEIISDFVYKDLFEYIPVDLSIKVDFGGDGIYIYGITIAETWFY